VVAAWFCPFSPPVRVWVYRHGRRAGVGRWQKNLQQRGAIGVWSCPTAPHQPQRYNMGTRRFGVRVLEPDVHNIAATLPVITAYVHEQ